MKQKLLAVFLSVALLFSTTMLLWGQSTPTVTQSNFGSAGITTTGEQTDIVNKNQQAVAWRLTFWFTGFSSVEMEIDCAPDNGSGGPGTYVAMTGAYDSTTNPVTISSSPNSGSIAAKEYCAHVAVNVVAVSGSGKIFYLLLGYSGTSAGVGNGGGGAPSGPAGGDLGGTYPNPTALHLGHVTDSSLQNSGLQNPSTTVNGQTCTLGSTCTVTAGPTGTAGGDLSGSYPNPTVAKINATTVPVNSTADQFLGTTSAAAGAWASMPNCGDTSHAVGYSTSTHLFSCQNITGSAASPSFPVNAQTSTYQVLAADFSACKTISVASGTFNVTLVASGSQPTNGQCIWVINYGTGVVTIVRSGQNINGGTSSLTVAAGSATAPTGAFVVSDGTNYEALLFGSSSGGGVSPSGFYLNSGSNYYIGPTFQLATLPVAGNYTWVNQGGATETATGNALVLSAPNGAGDNLRIREIAMSATTTLTVNISCTLQLENFTSCGIGFRESSTGKLVIMANAPTTSGTTNVPGGNGIFGPTIDVARWNSATSFNAHQYQQPFPVFTTQWLQIALTGGNIVFRTSQDGVTFVQQYSESETAFFTTAPDNFIYFANSNNTLASQPAKATLFSWLAQ